MGAAVSGGGLENRIPRMVSKSSSGYVECSHFVPAAVCLAYYESVSELVKSSMCANLMFFTFAIISVITSALVFFLGGSKE